MLSTICVYYTTVHNYYTVNAFYYYTINIKLSSKMDKTYADIILKML